MHSVIDNGNGVKTHIALQDGNLITGTSQDCTSIMERVKALRNEGYHGSKDMRHAGSAPFVVVEEYCNKKGITFREFCNEESHRVAFLNSPEYAACRIWEGKV